MTTRVVFETHATTEDNEAGIATGWLDGRLSAAGREQARRLGMRRRDDGLDAVVSSDLGRAVETVRIAFSGSQIAVSADRRLRECHYGSLDGAPRELVLGDRPAHLDAPYPGGESWRDAVRRVAGFLGEVPSRWPDGRVLLVGHVATRLALDHVVLGVPLERLLAEDFVWRPGWEYELDVPGPLP